MKKETKNTDTYQPTKKSLNCLMPLEIKLKQNCNTDQHQTERIEGVINFRICYRLFVISNSYIGISNTSFMLNAKFHSG